MGAGGNDRLGHQAVIEDFPRAVDVGEEGLKGSHPLGNTPREAVPLEGTDDARYQVEGEGSLFAAVGEGHTAVNKGARELVGALAQFGGVE